MGLDVLDLVFRLECTFGLKINRGEVDAIFDRNQPPDIRLGDLFEHVMVKAAGVGTTPRDDAETWPTFQQVVADSMGVEPAGVTKATWLIRELGSR